jgi:hypothetical protein
VGAAPLPPSITAEDLTDTLHVCAPSPPFLRRSAAHFFFVFRFRFVVVGALQESIEECTRDGQQLPATKTTVPLPTIL